MLWLKELYDKYNMMANLFET